ncbi:MAG: InlB B-repeat-containing protein, partial [Oscillospiraceae bacterium]|nr:InlB B-repeat-containing protein [Oscillospiraceae bacterium]
MKQTGKMRTLCVALALLMVLLSLPFATATALQLPAPTPVVRTSGGQAKLTDVDDPSIQYNSAYDLTAEIISESVDRLKDPLLAAISKLDWTAAGNILGEFIWDNFGDLQMWPDGTSKHAVYRSGTDPVPGYDELGYVAPKHSNIVKFNSNGGSSVPDQSVLNGGKAVPPATPTRNYDTFDGWYRDAALTALWDFATVVTGDITLYAKWINYAGYVVTFNSNGGSSVPSQAIEIGNTAAAPPAPTRAGYTFVAWYSNAALTALWDFATVVTGDITLYAKWNALPTTPPTTPTEPTTAKPVIPPALADAFSKLVAKLEKALTHVGSAFEKFFGGLGNQLEDAFFGIYDGTQDYIDKNGLKATQPDPDPAWDNLDTIAPAVYNFDYDWRLSPIDVADQLNDYI